MSGSIYVVDANYKEVKALCNQTGMSYARDMHTEMLPEVFLVHTGDTNLGLQGRQESGNIGLQRLLLGQH